MWFKASALYYNACSYLKTFSFARLINLLKLFSGFFLSRLLRQPVMMARPFALSVEPSGHCQLKCPECSTGMAILNRKKGTMNLHTFSGILNETASYLYYLNLYLQGEPLLNPDIDKFISMAVRKNIYTTISTNGLLLDEDTCLKLVRAGLSRIVISLDGFSQPVYEKYRRGGNAEAVKNGILNLIEARSEFHFAYPLIVVQTLAFEHNIHELPQIKAWCKKSGVDKLEVKSAQINDFGDGSVKPWHKKSRYRKTSNQNYVIKGNAFNHCWRQWSSAVISWNGDMAPCCYDKDLTYNFGNTSNQTLGNAWKGINANNFRKSILINRTALKMCQNCPEGRNWLM
jgi:radical SAM protein with 4Fe4S-binding SPASM domain